MAPEATFTFARDHWHTEEHVRAVVVHLLRSTGMNQAQTLAALEAVMDLLRSGLLMRKTGDRRRAELTEESAF